MKLLKSIFCYINTESELAIMMIPCVIWSCKGLIKDIMTYEVENEKEFK
jgi:hypothetical protein